MLEREDLEMKNILNEIEKLHKKCLCIDQSNTNQYRLLLDNGTSKTAYYFSCPIYEEQSGKLVDLQFTRCKDAFVLNGSNAKVLVQSDGITLENASGRLSFSLPDSTYCLREHALFAKTHTIRPTLNGIALTFKSDLGFMPLLHLKTDRPFFDVRANKKTVSLMADRFLPFATVGLIGVKRGEEWLPSSILLQQESGQSFITGFDPRCKEKCEITVEIGLYENKLIQDTTVESRNAYENNVYGASAFLGYTDLCGEQWLYSKFDTQKLSDLFGVHLIKAQLYIPKLCKGAGRLSAFRVATRFCSFGWNWENKVDASAQISDIQSTERFVILDVTKLLDDCFHGALENQGGFILKSAERRCGYSVLSTADSYSAPQILKVEFD